MNREDHREIKLLQDGIASILQRTYHTAPTMVFSDMRSALSLAFNLGKLIGRNEKQKDIELFQSYDDDEEKKGRRTRCRNPDT